jgi:hypothetical protein
MKKSVLKLVLIAYVSGCIIYTVVQAVVGHRLGFTGSTWLHGSLLHALYSPWWPLLLVYHLS